MKPCSDKLGENECQLLQGHEGKHRSKPFETTLTWAKGDIGRTFYDPLPDAEPAT